MEVLQTEVHDDITEVKNVDTTSSVDEIDAYLNSFKKAATVTSDEQEQPKKHESVAIGPNERVPDHVAKANPDKYYTRGSKKGLPKNSHTTMSQNNPPQKEMEISGSLIDGALFIMLIDLLFPLIITMVNNKVSKDKIDVEDLQLTEKQKKDLEPIATEAMKSLSMRANPMMLMVLSFAGIYGINFMAAKTNVK